MNRSTWCSLFLASIFGAVAIVQEAKSDGSQTSVPAAPILKANPRQDESEKDKTQEPATESPFEKLKLEFDEVMKEAQTEQQAIIKEYRESKNDEERSAVIEKLRKSQEPFEARQTEIGLKIAELLDKVEAADESFEIIEWLLQNSRDDKTRAAAVAKLIEQHLSNEKILELIPVLQRGGANEAAQNALEAIADKGGSDSIKGAALISLAEYLFQFKSMYSELAAESPDALKALPESDAAYFKKIGEVTDEKIEGLLNNAIENFADVEYKESTIGELAKKQLRSIEVQRNLAVGKEAPDIEGKDIDGETFKLSDYRGKVVMLDFWGHW